MAKGTIGYDFMMKATQYSDFVSRYALYNHHVNVLKEEGKSEEEAIQLGMDLFINYELPTSPELQWAQDHGLILFTRYPIRIVKALVNMGLNKPVNAFLGMFLLDKTVGNVSEPSDSIPSFNPGTILDLPDRLLEGITPQGAMFLAENI